MSNSNVLAEKHIMLSADTEPFEAAKAFYGVFHRWPAHVVYPVGKEPTVEPSAAQMLRDRGVKVQVLTEAKLYCFIGPIAAQDVRVVER